MIDEGAPTSPAPTWSVAELHEALNGLLVHVFGEEMWVEGELRNTKRSANGHVYFDLVDTGADDDRSRPMLAVTLFSKERQAVNRYLTRQGGAVRMGDGVRVRIRGRLNVYGARSTLQLRMSWIDPAFTLGVLGQQRERTLAALAAEGLLERNGALTMPAVALHVALVTSVGSAAHADALDEFARAGIGFRVSVLDARTQGVDAERSIIAALHTAASLGAEVVVLVRGGGARTDLAAFDADGVARAIASCEIPVLTGIGHEIDRTVADQVAHTAHKTPTAAAAAVAESARRYAERLEQTRAQMAVATRGRLVRAAATADQIAHRAGRAATLHLSRDAQAVEHLVDRLSRAAPQALTSRRRVLDDLGRRVAPAATDQLRRLDHLTETLELRMRAHDPAVSLARGWSVTRGPDGQVLRSTDEVRPGDEISTVLADGTVTSTVERTTAPEPDAADTTGPTRRRATGTPITDHQEQQ